MNDKDLQIEDLVGKEGDEKKKVDGKAKGDRTEKNLCKLLADHFGEPFTKAPGSGAFTSQIDHLPEHAKKTLTGDICGPENFKWVIECKGGYENDISLSALDGKGLSRLDEFIEQTTKDADYCGRRSIICWKRNRKPWLAMLRQSDLCHNDDVSKTDLESLIEYRLYYREWIMISLTELLEHTKEERDFWFYEGK